MALTQFIYDPFTEFDRLFDDAFSSRFRPDRPDSDESRPTTIRPKMDLIAKPDNQVVARFELPGMNQQNVKVEVHNDRLTISGEKKSEAGEGQFAVRERSYGSFARTLQLPEGTKPEQVQARMQDGILEVTFPKAPPEQETKAITIEAPTESTKQTGTKK
ncbi:HSP20-like chaperone [Suillus clintonianus]|uniref:HSP20-like chaperone n=1 Tax=Suillus clintonianus TaxID=1904413 RepID=UPI001B875F35|nr:HSP20-like chaperone [Suillus clintonianus]KAG2126030.1 HSP20-like chaperone [Suillus clintonianus]